MSNYMVILIGQITSKLRLDFHENAWRFTFYYMIPRERGYRANQLTRCNNT